MSTTTDRPTRHRMVTSLGLVAALALIACAPEEEQASFEEVEPTAAAGEGNTGAEEGSQDDEDEATDDHGNSDADAGNREEPERDLSEPVVVQQRVWDFVNEQDVDIEVTIDPFMRDSFEGDDYISGHMTYEVVSEDGEFALDQYGTAPAEVRLFDPRDPEFLYYPNGVATETLGEMAADVEGPIASAGEGPLRWAAIYTDPGTDSISVLLPYVGLVEDVGIVDRAEVSPQDYLTYGQSEEPFELILHNEFPLDIYRERAGGDINIREEGGESVITLDAEVLFDSDEYTIRDDAEEALASAAEELERASGGELQIVGHTDNIDTEDYNQTLSENRAEAVHQQLGELTDLSAFDEVSTEGRSLREPIASNDTEEGRQANRRVELHFTPPEPGEFEDLEGPGDSGDMPAPQGPVGQADEPLTVTAADGRASEITVEEVYRTGEVLVGRVSVEVTDLPEETDGAGALAWPVSFGETGAREDHDNVFNPGTQTDALTLLIGNQRIFPLEYGATDYVEIEGDGEVVEGDHPWYMPLTDRGFGYDAPAGVGTRATATVIWPNIPGDTVTIDVPGETEHAYRPYSDPFRFTEVPVEDLSSVEADDEEDDIDSGAEDDTVDENED
ncbi:OmpA family protein [Nesterenkonia muleiensis]|uniref:OmpA family protein n=1 Tax=Nesterenkonia muleiensis TaxID=2282648 RepID=UPI0013003B7D|nr:OmpA family protein [Nesterenkonia muleiensis]